MKRYFSILFLLIAAVVVRVSAQNNDGKLFQYPTVPDSKVQLSERCNYLVDHFWDRCNVKQALSSQAKFSDAFGDWISFMPYATADTVHMAIDRFLKSVEKLDKQLPILGRIAESWLYADSAEYMSEELYYPFAKAVASNKKVPSAQRARFELQEQRLRSSKVDDTAADFPVIAADGSKTRFSEHTAPYMILFFNDPDCSDCTLARLRLSADYNTTQLIEKGLLKIVSIFPGEASDDEWQKAISRYPAEWIVGASPEVDGVYTMDKMPAIYYLDENHKILAKDLVVDNVLNAMRILNQAASAVSSETIQTEE